MEGGQLTCRGNRFSAKGGALAPTSESKSKICRAYPRRAAGRAQRKLVEALTHSDGNESFPQTMLVCTMSGSLCGRPSFGRRACRNGAQGCDIGRLTNLAPRAGLDSGQLQPDSSGSCRCGRKLRLARPCGNGNARARCWADARSLRGKHSCVYDRFLFRARGGARPSAVASASAWAKITAGSARTRGAPPSTRLRDLVP